MCRLVITLIAFGLWAGMAAADATTLTCVVNAGRNLEARDIALQCGVGEEELRDIRAILEKIEGDAAAQRTQLDRMEALLAGLGERSITDTTLIGLAQRISAQATDAQTALIELSRAVDIATELRDEAQDNPSTDAFVAEVMRRVAELNDRALFTEGGDEIDRALALLEAEQENLRRRQIELLENALAQDVLRGDVEAAADRRIRLIETREQRAVQVAELRRIAGEQYAYALRFGGKFELDLAIALTDRAMTRAGSGYDIAELRNDNGTHWRLSGARGYSEDGLARSVAAYRAALQVRTRADHPADWAETQNNLCIALRTQGRRSRGAQGKTLLTEAIAACHAALQVYTQADFPMDWAVAQNNLGNALREQGRRKRGATGTRLLAEAVEAYRAALQVRTRADHPLDWAESQNQLGNALRTQGRRAGGAEGTGLLAEAVGAYRAALEVRTRAELPVEWAITQNNLGAALEAQGVRTGGAAGTALLAEAVATYGAALQVRTRQDHPVQWAKTQWNLAIAQKALAEHPATPDPRPSLEAALSHASAALEFYGPGIMAGNHAKVTELSDEIQAALAAD